MVHHMMSDEFLFRQKTFLALTALRVHGREHNVWWILSRQKTFITFTALRVHGTLHDVCWISFSSKNVFHILCMVQHMMFCHFLRFSHFPQASAHDFSSSVGIFNSPILSENLIWKYQTCENIHCYHHSCPNITAALAAHAQYPRVGRACAVTARQPRQLWHERSALTWTNSLGN